MQYCIFNDKKNLSEIDLKVVKLGPFFDILQSLAMTNEIFLTTKKQQKEGILFRISEEEIKSSAILCFLAFLGLYHLHSWISFENMQKISHVRKLLWNIVLAFISSFSFSLLPSVGFVFHNPAWTLSKPILIKFSKGS